MKLALCCYRSIGLRVLEHVLGRSDVSDLAVFTHAQGTGAPDIVAAARAAQVPVTEESINRAKLPFQPDIVASVYYRDIIGGPIINAVGGRIFNVHPALLPRHRGCSSVPWAIIEGDAVTGVTFHYIKEKVDSGPILLQATIPIEANETQATLYEKCMEAGLLYWPAAFELVKAGIAGVSQAAGGCYHRRGVPLDGVIEEGWDEARVDRFIRAMTFPPLPYAKFRGAEIRTLEDYRRVLSGST